MESAGGVPGRNGGHSLDYARLVFKRRGDGCAICRGARGPIDYSARRTKNPLTGKLEMNPLGLHVDHVVPSSEGGSDALSNLQATHAICNLQAGSKRKRYVMRPDPPKPRTSRDW